jgi:hypothetical protein
LPAIVAREAKPAAAPRLWEVEEIVDESGFLDGGIVLPGLKISMRELVARANGSGA